MPLSPSVRDALVVGSTWTMVMYAVKGRDYLFSAVILRRMQSFIVQTHHHMCATQL